MSIIDIYQGELTTHDKDELVTAFSHPQFKLLVSKTIKFVEQQLINIDEDSNSEEVGKQYKSLKRQLAVYRELEELSQLSQLRIESWKEK